MYNIRKQEDICGYILEKTKVDIITIGVMKEVENFTNVVVQLLLGKASMENFKMDIASIILTLTKLMTELKTLDVLQKKNINIYMGGKGKITKLLKELNIESVKDAKNINQLMNFKNEVLELIKDIVSRVSVKPYRNGEQKIKNIITPIIENTEKNTRFFYAAKTSKHERNLGCEELETKLVLNPGDVCAGKNLKTAPNGKPNKPIYSKNYHPTVKPIALMSYLINLVTPPKGIILDPFMGSGSTGVAATKEGFEFIGIELNKEYYEIANKRIEYAIKNKENIFTV